MKQLLTIMFVTTLALLSSVRSTLAAGHYSQPAPTDPAVLSTNPSDPKLFDKVAFNAQSNLGRALLDLRIAPNRLAIIVPQGDSHENQIRGEIGRSHRTTEFMVIFADRDLSIDAKQLGSSRQSCGILNLKDLAVQLLSGQSFIIDKQIVWIAPSAGAIVQMEWKEDSAPASDLKGRESWHQLFTATAGVMRTEVGRRT